MKYLNLLLLLIVLGCNSPDAPTIQFLKNGIESGTEYLTDMNNDNYSKIEAAYYENPNKVRKHKKLTDSLKVITSSIMRGYKSLHSKPDNKDLIERELSKDLTKFKTIIDNLANKDSALFSLAAIICDEDIAKPLIDKELLINKLRLLENYILDKKLQKIQGLNFHVNKLMVGVFPKEYKLKANDLFEAKLRLIAIDTTIVFKANIDKKTFLSNNGVINYIDSTITSKAEIIKKSHIYWSAPSSNITLDFPISLKYQIKEK